MRTFFLMKMYITAITDTPIKTEIIFKKLENILSFINKI